MACSKVRYSRKGKQVQSSVDVKLPKTNVTPPMPKFLNSTPKPNQKNKQCTSRHRWWSVSASLFTNLLTFKDSANLLAFSKRRSRVGVSGQQRHGQRRPSYCCVELVVSSSARTPEFEGKDDAAEKAEAVRFGYLDYHWGIVFAVVGVVAIC